MHIHLLNKKIELERQAFIDSAKFVEKMNKERRDRDVRIQKQREKLIKKMDKLHQQIEGDMLLRRRREEEEKEYLKNKMLMRADNKDARQPTQAFRIHRVDHHKSSLHQPDPDQDQLDTHNDDRRSKLPSAMHQASTTNAREEAAPASEYRIRVTAAHQNIAARPQPASALSKASNYNGHPETQPLQLPPWNKYNLNPYAYSNNLEAKIRKEEEVKKKKKFHDPKEKQKKVELLNRRRDYGKYVKQYYLPKNSQHEEDPDAPEARSHEVDFQGYEHQSDDAAIDDYEDQEAGDAAGSHPHLTQDQDHPIQTDEPKERSKLKKSENRMIIRTSKQKPSNELPARREAAAAIDKTKPTSSPKVKNAIDLNPNRKLPDPSTKKKDTPKQKAIKLETDRSQSQNTKRAADKTNPPASNNPHKETHNRQALPASKSVSKNQTPKAPEKPTKPTHRPVDKERAAAPNRQSLSRQNPHERSEITSHFPEHDAAASPENQELEAERERIVKPWTSIKA